MGGFHDQGVWLFKIKIKIKIKTSVSHEGHSHLVSLHIHLNAFYPTRGSGGFKFRASKTLCGGGGGMCGGGLLSNL